jgi:hypothetical protein
MNYFKLIVALLASASIVSSALFPSEGSDEKPTIKLTDENCCKICELLLDRDDPVALARLLDGVTPTYDLNLFALMQTMIALSRNRLFEFLYPIL